jgi:hypothetical protein
MAARTNLTDERDGFEKALVKQAIGEVYPRLTESCISVVPANAMPLVIFCGMFYTPHRKGENDNFLEPGISLKMLGSGFFFHPAVFHAGQAGFTRFSQPRDLG